MFSWKSRHLYIDASNVIDAIDVDDDDDDDMAAAARGASYTQLPLAVCR